MPTLTDFSARSLDGNDIDLSTFTGQVALVVNTATKCGYTGQLAGLQQLHDDFAGQGFTVLGFPSDQFKQEPVADDEMAAVCQRNYGVTFPMFAKVAVNGRESHPLYHWLRSQKRGLLGGRINWNFTKFLIDRDGKVLARYGPTTEPQDIAADIEIALSA